MSYSRPPGGQKAAAGTPYNEAKYQLERRRIQIENEKKTERLKALRLVKEAAEQLEAANAPPVKKRGAKKAATP